MCSLRRGCSLRCALTSLLQGHHGGLRDEVSLNKAAEVLAVHAQVRQLEGVDRHLQRELLPGTLACHMHPCQRHDGRAGMGDTSRETFLCRPREKHRGMCLLPGYETFNSQRISDSSMFLALQHFFPYSSDKYLLVCGPAVVLYKSNGLVKKLNHKHTC